MVRRSIDDILADDDQIEDLKPVSTSAPGEDRLFSDFEDINRFIDVNGREPQEPNLGSASFVSPSERILAIRLKKLRSDTTLLVKLKDLDRHSLFARAQPETLPDNLDAVLDHLDALEGDDMEDIFVLRHVRSPQAVRDGPDYVASRRKCLEFHKFKPLLDECAAQLKSGQRKSIRFANEAEIDKGDFYIVKGMLLYIADMETPEISGKAQRPNARLRCIYDNGTESDLLLRSLARQLYGDENGRKIVPEEVGPLFAPAKLEEDRLTGYVYVARCEQQPDALKQYKELYKIGVTTGHPKSRVSASKDDPTFLFTKAVLLKQFAIYNTEPRQVEAKLHAFLASACLQIEIGDRFNRPYQPKEWFIVPMSAIDETVMRIFDGTLTNFEYDMLDRKLVPRAT